MGGASCDASEGQEVVTIAYQELLDPSTNISAKIEAGFGPGALGLITLSGVPSFKELRGRLLPLAQAFADLPGDVKAKYEDPDSFWSFGWSHGKEILQGGKPDKCKGSYYGNPCHDKPTEDEHLMNTHPSYCRPNIWPGEDLPALESAFKDLGMLMVEIGKLLAERCDRYVKSKVSGAQEHRISNSMLGSVNHKARLLHYFPPSEVDLNAEDAAGWCGWHRDHCFLTGLCSAMYTRAGGEPVPCPDSQAGLYIESRKGQIQRVSIPADHIAYQMGEATQAITGGLLHATPHYVQAPKKDVSRGIGRNTFAVFMQPHWEEVMELPSWANEDDVRSGGGLAGWQPGITFGDFTTKTLTNYH